MVVVGIVVHGESILLWGGNSGLAPGGLVDVLHILCWSCHVGMLSWLVGEVVRPMGYRGRVQRERGAGYVAATN